MGIFDKAKDASADLRGDREELVAGSGDTEVRSTDSSALADLGEARAQGEAGTLLDPEPATEPGTGTTGPA